MDLGPRTRDQFARFAQTWNQGEHVVVSGGTGSGKTALGRHIDQVRIDRGGFVVVFVCKLRPDQTILDDYKGFVRWDHWKKHPSPHENKVLLWPNTDKIKGSNFQRQARDLQRDVFGQAFDGIARNGKWTVDLDEGLYMCSNKYMNMEDDVAMLHALGRSSGVTIVTKMQRPSNVPLIIYGSASHAFVGRTRERADVQRLAELGSRQTSKEMQARISALGRHDFMWLPVAPDWEPEIVNLRS